MTTNWKLTNDSTRKRLARAFTNRAIDFSKPGFCDAPAFLEEEAQNPRFLETYAEYVECQSYSPDYLADASRKITVAGQAVGEAVAADGRQGACVDASGMLGRMLDRLGVWNYVAKSTLKIDFPVGSGLKRRFFWALDEGNFVAPHAIVVAPPFGIVDVTVRHQRYKAGEICVLPPSVVSDQFELVSWDPEDLANTELRAYVRMRGVSFRKFLETNRPAMIEVMSKLPPRRVAIGGTTLKYVIVAVGGTIEKLEGITGYKPAGKTALQIFEQQVLPKLS